MTSRLQIGALSLALAGAAAASPALAGADDGGSKSFYNAYGVEAPDAAPAQAQVYGTDRDATATVQQYDQYRAQGRRIARRPVVSE